tara:strand:+ start:387 stop:1166 length:780 start_codon:yes stop_codon:yes gene_type:complete
VFILIKSGQVAIVTGASSGIGLAFCYALAKRGVKLVLVARSEDRLLALSQELERDYAISSYVVPLDLSRSDAVFEIRRVVQSFKLSVDVIINNAGFDDFGDFLETPWTDHASMLQAMLICPTRLCYEFLPDMKKKQAGCIINVGSIVGLFTLKLFKRSRPRVLYGPIKSYLIDYTRSLSRRYRADGIVCQALCPGLTWSEFHQRSGESDIYKRIPKRFWLTSEAVVDQSLAALSREKTVVVTGWYNQLLNQLHRRIFLG